MKLNRRNAIIGLGSAAVGTGALLGTGAFTTVEAQRDVAITTENDDNALVQLYPTEKGEEFLDLGEDTGEASIDLETGIADSEAVPGDGLSDNSVTVIDDLFRIVNAGTQSVLVSIHDALNDLSGSSDTFADLDTADHGVGFFVAGGAAGARDDGDGVDEVPLESVETSSFDYADIDGVDDARDLSAGDLNTELDESQLDEISVSVGIVVDTGGLADNPAGEFTDSTNVDVTIIANAN